VKKNLGTADRVVRFVIGLVLLYLWYTAFSGTTLGTLFLILGIISVVESFISYCGIYDALNINTYRKAR